MKNLLKQKKSADSQEQVSNFNSTVSDLQSKKNTNSETVNSSTTASTSESDDIKYEISKKKNQYGDEAIAVIKATKEGKTTTKEFEMDALITDTGTMILPTIGSVALVAETSGEYYAFKVFRLSEDYTNGKTQEIVEAGTLKYSL